MPVVLSHLPNLITALRGLSGPAIAVLVLAFDLHEVAFAVFLGAVLTDLVDGWLARSLGASSRLGELLDPVCDKLLVDSTWLTLGLAGWAPWWLVGPMLLRDALVILGFVLLGGRGLGAPHLLGRLMVSVEGVALGVFLFRTPWVDTHWPSVGLVLGLLSLALAVGSAIVYAAHAVRCRVGSQGASVLRPSAWRPPSTPT